MLVLGELESTFLSSLRGSEATEAIHTQKADSSMDRRADKSARDDKVGGSVSRVREKRATQENAFSKHATGF